MGTASKSKNVIFQLKIVLADSKPEIWRRVQVPASMTLKKLHHVIQDVMGWQNSHLHDFEVAGKRYTDPSFEDDAMDEDDLALDEGRIKLAAVAKSSNRFLYRYDFGDAWEHKIIVEDELPAEEEVQYPICIGGENACPPEDCGGIGGYADMVEKLADPKNPEHDETRQWLGGFFDPRTFDPNHINREHLWAKRW